MLLIQTAQKIFGGDIKVHVLLFGSSQSDTYEKIREEFQGAAKNFRGKVIRKPCIGDKTSISSLQTLFVTVDGDETENERVLEYFGLQKSELPSIRLITLKDQMTKYKPDFTEITSSGLTTFVNAFFADKLKPHLLSQEVPEDWDANPVKVLVGKNFHEVATDKSKTVLVTFVAPW